MKKLLTAVLFGVVSSSAMATVSFVMCGPLGADLGLTPVMPVGAVLEAIPEIVIDGQTFPATAFADTEGYYYEFAFVQNQFNNVPYDLRLMFCGGWHTFSNVDLGMANYSNNATAFPVDLLFLPGVDPMLPCPGGQVGANDLAPTQFALGAAYPNPFNPSTTINFDLPQSELVSLTVYNLSGQVVRELANGQFNTGRHQVVFDASDLASGVYLYTLKAGSFTESQKMVLVK